MKKLLTFAILASTWGGFAFAQQENTETLVSEDFEILEENIDQPAIIDWDNYDLDISESYAEPSHEKADLSKLMNGRALEEINTEGDVDAYPWISEDGLRVYFTQAKDNNDMIVMATRIDINSDFGDALPLNINFENDDNMSCWLTKDELTIYFTVSQDNMTLYKATRENCNDEFGVPEEITLNTDEEIGFFSAPSLTQDGEQLYMYQSSGGQHILQFERTAENVYSLVQTLSEAEMVAEPDPGQISMDGLHYYCTGHSSDKLMVFSRKNLDEDFSFEKTIQIGQNFHQISVGQKWMVLCHSPNNTWSTNDLYIAESPFEKAVEEPVVLEEPVVVEAEAPAAQDKQPAIENQLQGSISMDIKVFPNPADEFVNVQFELPEATESATLEIFDLQGKVLKIQQINGAGQHTLNVNVSEFPAGTYFCRVRGEQIDSVVKTLIVK